MPGHSSWSLLSSLFPPQLPSTHTQYTHAIICKNAHTHINTHITTENVSSQYNHSEAILLFLSYSLESMALFPIVQLSQTRSVVSLCVISPLHPRRVRLTCTRLYACTHCHVHALPHALAKVKCRAEVQTKA